MGANHRAMQTQRSHWSVRGVEITHSARPYFSSTPARDDKVGSSS